ncbi:hypothetical protein [Thalassotalea profundi]|uniref:SGNH/GDSL hydrolase family protein n=1 Tax=Thalassotalea profundi TaxID=2036687 RepID=A0ABQ3IH92_9GAMM|nr:hypothetical protein [Thalassotalea profundi]GHE84492.1 hypothetical protein GCM10011501_11520 [Thalassotalea profundi]
MRTVYYFIILFYLSGCSGSADNATKIAVEDKSNEEISSTNLAIPDNRFSNTYEVVLFGNSHISGLDSLISSLIKVGSPFATVNVVSAGGGFLDNPNTQSTRETLLDNQAWTHVILQGQKYSESGSYTYPTAPTKLWIAKAKENNITPILFPEHPRKDNKEEAMRVHQIHTGISASQRACVAPIGLAWDSVLAIDTQLQLHSSDGNHASLLGKLLTSYIFYEIITGEPADLLPYIDNIDIDEPSQQLLKQFASETIQSNQPCIFDA